MRNPTRALLVLALFGAAGCDNDPNPIDPVPVSLTAQLRGTVARDSVVRLRVLDGTTEVAAGQFTLAATPDSVVQLLGGDSLRFVAPGAVKLTARYRGAEASVEVNVPVPPALNVALLGTLARDSVVHALVRSGTTTLATGVTLQATPASAVQLLGGDSLRLLTAGPLTVRATRGRDTGSVVVNVAAQPPLAVSVTGRMMRGSVARVEVRRTAGGSLLPGVELAFTPAEAVQALGGDSVRLVRDGALTVRAVAGRDTGAVTVSVAAPPPLAITTTGRALRGQVLRFRVAREGTTLPAGEAALTFTPADAVQALGGDSVRLVRTAVVQVRAATTYEAGALEITVAEPPPLAVTLAGRAERGLVLRVAVAREGTALAAGEATLTFTPADAVQALGGDSVRLVRTGALQVRAATPYESGEASATVATPPSIVFDRMTDGNRDIWRVALDGADLTRLTTEPAEDNDPTVAGTRVVFVSYRLDRNAELFSMSVTGGAATRLTTTASNETMPALSPNGDSLAYTSEASGLPKLWMARADGTGGARASALGGDFALDASPAWFPDNRRVVFMSTANGNADLFSIVRPAAPVSLTSGSPVDVEPAVSPDGDRIVYGSARSGGTTDLYLLRLSTGAITRLTTSPNSEGQPAWTADGRVIYTEFVNGAGRLRWLDPAAPGTVHTIETGAGSARNATLIP